MLISTTLAAVPLTSKIARGIPVKDPLTFPFMISIEKISSNEQFCGAVFYPPHFLITAAHCSNDVVLQDLVVYGSRPNRSDTTTGIAMKVIKIDRHPLYNSTTSVYDAAVWTLSDSVMPQQPEIVLESGDVQGNAMIAGWGALYGDPMLRTNQLNQQTVCYLTWHITPIYSIGCYGESLA